MNDGKPFSVQHKLKGSISSRCAAYIPKTLGKIHKSASVGETIGVQHLLLLRKSDIKDGGKNKHCGLPGLPDPWPASYEDRFDFDFKEEVA